MNRAINQSLYVGLWLVFSVGCATHYPMGLSREHWEALPPEKQAELHARQYELDEQRHQQAAAAHAERQRQQQAAMERERERIATLYANARYGDMVRVTIEGGALEYYNRLHGYHPVAFEIARGETKTITVTQSGQVQQTVPFQVRLSEDGHSLSFNEGRSQGEVFVERNWEKGQTYSMPPGLRGGFALPGATVFIQYKELPGAPERLVIEHR